MLAHLPGRMSQPSRKGITSNIFILRCSFHETAKRLSITSLTHLLRLRSAKNNAGLYFTWLSVIRNVILLQIKWKKKYEVSQTFKQTTLNCQCDWQYPPLLQIRRQQNKKSRIGLLHRNQFPEGTQLPWTIISQIYRKKKICLKALTIQLSIAYLCDTHNNERLKLPQNATPFYTRCTQSFWMTSKRHPIKPIMFSLREETQCFRI